MKDNNTIIKKITYGGIITATNIIFMYLASIFPTGRLSFLAVASITISIMVIEFKVSGGIYTYIATTIIGLLLVPSKGIIIVYGLFFGYYGIVKYFIEKLNNMLLEWILKLIIFNIVFSIAYKIMKEVLFSELVIEYGFLIILIALEILFIIYDYAYSLVINFYNYKLRDRLFKGR